MVATDPHAAAYGDLVARAPGGRPVVIAEAGLPTAGAPAASEGNQEAFFQCLAGRGLPFAYFEAFDQPRKQDDAVAPQWGLFGVDRTPKRWAATALGGS